MGIYLRGATMPLSCRDCAVGVCLIRLLKDDQNYDRHPQCPLVEVKEPHGDLIDRERIDYKNYKMHDGRGKLVLPDTFADGVLWISERIYETPTVIEAEGEYADK